MGKRNGKGILYNGNGRRYEGEWENDKKNGNGLMVFENGSFEYGVFKGDRMVMVKDRSDEEKTEVVSIYINDILIGEEEVKKLVLNMIARNFSKLFNIYKRYR